MAQTAAQKKAAAAKADAALVTADAAYAVGDTNVPPGQDTPVAEETQTDGRPVPADVHVATVSATAPLSSPDTSRGRISQREDTPKVQELDVAAGAAGIRSLAGDTPEALYDEDGKKITSSDGLFEDLNSDGLRFRVTKRVEEQFTPRNAHTPIRRLLYAKGVYVPRAEMLRFSRHLDDS